MEPKGQVQAGLREKVCNYYADDCGLSCCIIHEMFLGMAWNANEMNKSVGILLPKWVMSVSLSVDTVNDLKNCPQKYSFTDKSIS